MKNLAFVIWMLGYPLFLDASKIEPSSMPVGLGIILILIWAGVGVALYESTG